MAHPVTFCLVLHNHQPVGNFGHVFEKAMEQCYSPFLDLLERFPQIKVTLHVSGSLFDWIEENRPAYLDRLARLVESGRVEMLGGGYYEPILTAIPEDDAAHQLGTMSDYLLRRFGKRPRGIWLTERIWEPGLPRVLAGNGVEYTLLDQNLFLAAGLPRDALFGHYVSEKLGHKVHVFPIRKDLRYVIPFGEPARTIEILRHMSEVAPGACVTYGDDGEKFGVWPETYNWVYERGWLSRFFAELSENSDWITTATMNEAFEARPASGRVYLPAASYRELCSWALPTEARADLDHFVEHLRNEGVWDAWEPFIRAGYWDNFLTKYSESNWMHKRMLFVSEKVRKCPERSVHTGIARRELMMGQCNCAYWHGLFGGIYLNYLRDAVCRHLSRAEFYADLMLSGGSSRVHVEMRDFDADGLDEVILESPWYRAVLKPDDGATLRELVLVRRDFCVSNVIMRRPEPYHDRVRSEMDAGVGERPAGDGLRDFLFYDRRPRASLRDHFYAALPGLTSVVRQEDTPVEVFADKISLRS